MRILIVCIFFFISCDKILDLPTNNSFLQINDVENDQDLLVSYSSSIYNDLYYILNNDEARSPKKNLSIVLGALADEFEQNVPFSASNISLQNSYKNDYFSTGSNDYEVPDFFVYYLKIVIKCNNVLELISHRDNKDYLNLSYEIRTIRAILYYYLLSVYEKLPILVSSKVEENYNVKLSDRHIVVSFFKDELASIHDVITDKKLKINFEYSTNHYTERINKDVLAYYLSMYYMMLKEYDKAIPLLKSIIDKFDLEQQVDAKFKLTSSENIWVLSPSFPMLTINYNNPNATFLNHKLVPISTPFASSRAFSINKNVINSFSYSDKRVKYIDSVFYNGEWKYLPYRYKSSGNFDINSSERFIILRLPVVYYSLIEAYYMNKENLKSISYFNEISHHYDPSFVDINEISIHKILNERFKETFGEMGDRWISLKRTGLLDSVMRVYLPFKSNNERHWNPNSMTYFAIPITQTLLNPNLK